MTPRHPESDKGKKCPACLNEKVRHWKSNELNLHICLNCNLVFQAKTMHQIYKGEYYDYWDLNNFEDVRRMKVLTSEKYIQIICNDTEVNNGNLLDVGCAYGFTLEAARKSGFNTYGVEVSPAATIAKERGYEVFRGEVDDAPFKTNFFDVVILIDLIEHIADPITFMKKLRTLLRDTGIMLIVTPNIFSTSRKILGDRWFHYKDEHVCFYSSKSMETLLEKSGYRLLRRYPGFKHLTLKYINAHNRKYHKSKITKILSGFTNILPKKITNYPFKMPTETIYLANKK
tara:strand:+ start:22 stop:882 length:861 start_codon:yes stop_codon:yes gene_type:complete